MRICKGRGNGSDCSSRVDLAVDQNPLKNSGQWPAVALIGAIDTPLPAWDVDFG